MSSSEATAKKNNMDMAEQYIFYDLPSKHKGDDKPSCFSFNPWKTRMVLNYKSIPYETEFVEYPDLEAKLTAQGVEPNIPGTAWTDFTSPAIRTPSGKIVMNSANTVKELESSHPEPSLHLDAGLHGPATETVEALAGVVWWDALAQLPKTCLNERSAVYFEETRRARFGASLDDVAAARGGEQAWKTAAAPGGAAEKMGQFLTEHKKDEGPFILGSEPSYGDFIVASVFECFERISPSDYEKLISLHPTFRPLHEACRPWLARDD